MSLARYKTIRVAWKQIEDVLASHLYAVGAVPKDDEIIEILLKKTYITDNTHDFGNMNEEAEISIRYMKKGKQ